MKNIIGTFKEKIMERFHLMLFDIFTFAHNEKTLEHKVFIGFNGLWVAYALYSLITYKTCMSVYAYEYIVSNHWFISIFPSLFDLLYSSILFLFSFIARVNKTSIIKLIITILTGQLIKYFIMKMLLDYNGYFWNIFILTFCANIFGAFNVISYLLII